MECSIHQRRRETGHFWSQGKNKLMVQAAPPQVYSGLGYLVHGLVDPSLFYHLRDTSIVTIVGLLHNDTMSNRNDFGSCLSLLPNTKSRRWLHELLYGWGRIDRRTDGRTDVSTSRRRRQQKTFSVPRRDTRSGRKEEEKSFQNAHHNIIRNARTQENRYSMITRPEDAH